MVQGLLVIFVIISLWMLFWGLKRPDRYYQYPTLASITWLFYILPQAVGSAIMNPGKLPPQVVDLGGRELALLMCTLCAAAGWWGHSVAASRPLPQHSNTPSHNLDRFFWVTVAFALLALWGAWKLAQLSGGFREQFTQGGHYSTEWKGAPVKFSFFTRLLYPCLAICLYTAIRRASLPKWGMIVLLSLYPLACAVFLGRRGNSLTLALSMLIALWFTRGWAPPKILYVLIGPVAGILVVLAPYYRAFTQYGLNKTALNYVEAGSALSSQLTGLSYAEFDYMTVGISAHHHARSFGFGTGIYDSTIAQLVPAQIVGDELKHRLAIGTVNPFLLEAEFGWTPNYGSNPTGPLDAFGEFWFFGVFVFMGVGWLAGTLWKRASSGQFTAQIWYIVLAGAIPLSIYGSVRVIPGFYLPIVAMVSAILWITRNPNLQQTKKPRSSGHSNQRDRRRTVQIPS